MFLGFTNFNQSFIQEFSKIAAPLTSRLKTTTFSLADIERTPRSPRNSNFLTPEVQLAFSRLRRAFTKASMLHHFNPERYIQIETDVSNYTRDGILSQLTPESDQWNPVAFFSRIIILEETWYKTHDQELVAIVEALKPGATTYRNANSKFSYLQIIIISANLWIPRT